MSAFVLHPEAYADLEEIKDYIATDNFRAADQLIEEFYERFHSLAKLPHQGHSRPNLSSRPLSFVVLR
jgi:plasmid stabilization system protein ParE